MRERRTAGVWASDHVFCRADTVDPRGRREVMSAGHGTVCAALLLLVFAPPSIAASGWYLMIPPAEPPPREGRSQVPIRHWDTVRSFDSADDCERARELTSKLRAEDVEARKRLVTKTESDTEARKRDPSLLASTRGLLRRAEIEKERASAARCIAADDPRLVLNPVDPRGPKGE